MYWARSRVLEYLQQIRGRLPARRSSRDRPGRDRRGLGLRIRAGGPQPQHSLADLRSLQDWHLRYQLRDRPGRGGGRQHRRLREAIPGQARSRTSCCAYDIPLSTVIDACSDSNNEVGGRVLELSGARVHGSRPRLSALAGAISRTFLSRRKNGTPVLVRDLGSVTFGPDIREGVAEWNGEGETVGGIVVMRDGQNALNVIDGVKRKLAEIAPSLPPGVEMVPGYDRSGLIRRFDRHAASAT